LSWTSTVTIHPGASVADPDLLLDERWMKVFTVFYLLIGIGIIVEILRRLGRPGREAQPRDPYGRFSRQK
jgi:hypothetical protein